MHVLECRYMCWSVGTCAGVWVHVLECRYMCWSVGTCAGV